MLAKKSKKARQKREEVDRVVVDMDATAFSLEYRMVGVTKNPEVDDKLVKTPLGTISFEYNELRHAFISVFI